MRYNEIVSERSQKLEHWKEELRAADLEAALVPGARQITYEVHYRIHDDERREEVVDLIRTFDDARKDHLSTSNWIILSFIEDAEKLVKMIGAPIDEAEDYLEVAEVSENRASLGYADLKP